MGFPRCLSDSTILITPPIKLMTGMTLTPNSNNLLLEELNITSYSEANSAHLSSNILLPVRLGDNKAISSA